jgi:TPR repeat protein
MRTNSRVVWMMAILASPLAWADVISELTERAGNGEAAAMAELAARHEKGDGMARDMQAALNWYVKAAELGDAAAQMKLGSMYISGKGVKKDSAEAAKWFQLCAEQGNAAAQCQIGRMYLAGAGVVQNDVEAYKWAALAALQGDPAARKLTVHLTQRMSPSQLEEGRQRAADFLARQTLDQPLEMPVEMIQPTDPDLQQVIE